MKSLIAALVLWLHVGSLCPTAVGAAEARSASLHIRYRSDRIDAAFRYAMDRSLTFRQLVAEVEASTAIVYIVDRRCRQASVRSCLQIGSDGRANVMAIRIDGRQPLRSVIGQLAHELQHAVEVLAAPDVVDAPSLRALYARVGFRSCPPGSIECWETVKALDAERQVAFEILANPPTKAPETPPEYFGTWQLNVNESIFVNVPPPTSALRIHANRGYGLISVMSDTEETPGVHVRNTFVYRPDNRDYTLEHGPVRCTIAIEIIDRLTTESIVRGDGRVVSIGRSALSDDGRTLTITAWGANDRGEETRSITVWTKSQHQETQHR